MPGEDENIFKNKLRYNCMKAPFIIYADSQSLVEIKDTQHKSSVTLTKNKHVVTARRNYYLHDVYLIAIGISMITIKNKYYLKNISKYFKEHVIKIPNFEKMKILPLTEEENK